MLSELDVQLTNIVALEGPSAAREDVDRHARRVDLDVVGASEPELFDQEIHRQDHRCLASLEWLASAAEAERLSGRHLRYLELRDAPRIAQPEHQAIEPRLEPVDFAVGGEQKVVDGCR